jgi:hypothetical protein
MEIRYLVMASSDLEKSRNGTLLGFGGVGRFVGSLAGFDAYWSPRGPSRAASITVLTLSFVSSVKERINSDLCRSTSAEGEASYSLVIPVKYLTVVWPE